MDNNKFEVNPNFPDDRDFGTDREMDGVPSSIISSAINETKSAMDMNLAPNRFPRETGHDSLTEEEAQLC